MAGPNWKLEDDLTTVTLTLPTDPPVALELNAAGVDDILRNLGSFRALMTPEHSYDDPRGKKTTAINYPRWATEHERLQDEILLHVRDPRYGTLAYHFSREDARKLGQSLVELASAPPKDPGPAH